MTDEEKREHTAELRQIRIDKFKSRRAEISEKCVVALISKVNYINKPAAEVIAEQAVTMADAILKELEK